MSRTRTAKLAKLLRQARRDHPHAKVAKLLRQTTPTRCRSVRGERSRRLGDRVGGLVRSITLRSDDCRARARITPASRVTPRPRGARAQRGYQATEREPERTGARDVRRDAQNSRAERCGRRAGKRVSTERRPSDEERTSIGARVRRGRSGCRRIARRAARTTDCSGRERGHRIAYRLSATYRKLRVPGRVELIAQTLRAAGAS